MPTSKRGFTLIELLIAITIVAIIASVGFISYSQAQVLARDSRRKQDLGEIAKALQLYYNDNKRYPYTSDTVNGVWVWSNSAANPWIADAAAGGVTTPIPLGSNYTNKLPVDPINSGNYIYGYYGFSGNLYTSCKGGQYYLLAATLENTRDPQKFGNNPFPVCGNTDYSGTLTWANNYFLIAGP